MIRTTLMTAVLAVAAIPAAHAAPLDMAGVDQKLRAAGYTYIHEIEREDGLWEADVTRPDGRFSEVFVDPRSGEIFDEHDGRALLDTPELLQKAARHGLRDIHGLEREGATWKLEARNGRNQRVDVRLSGYDGRILHSEREGWLD